LLYVSLFNVLFYFSVSSEYSWPSGTYGLPETASGCPYVGKESSWKRGYTYHNTEDEFPANKRSQSYHFAANFSQHGIQQRFCIKDQQEHNEKGRDWPDGKYCIYKKGKDKMTILSGRTDTLMPEIFVKVIR